VSGCGSIGRRDGRLPRSDDAEGAADCRYRAECVCRSVLVLIRVGVRAERLRRRNRSHHCSDPSSRRFDVFAGEKVKVIRVVAFALNLLLLFTTGVFIVERGTRIKFDVSRSSDVVAKAE